MQSKVHYYSTALKHGNKWLLNKYYKISTSECGSKLKEHLQIKHHSYAAKYLVLIPKNFDS